MGRGPNNTPNVKLIKKKRRFLDELTKGHTIARTCALVGMSRRTYYQWRSDDKSFLNEADQIISDPVYRERSKLTGLAGKPLVSEDWREAWLLEYVNTGSRKNACVKVGVTASHIENCMDSEHDDYDPEFAAYMKEIQTLRTWEIEDEQLERAKTDSRVAGGILKSLIPEKYGENKSGATNVMFWFSGEGEAKAKSVLSELFSAPMKELN